MSRFALLVVSLSVVAAAQTPEKSTEKKAAKEAELKKKEINVAPDKSLAGDVTRKKEKHENAPTLQYDQFKLGVEVQVAEKRHSQIEDLKQIINLSQDEKEKPSLLFRLGELYWEEKQSYFFAANRKDDDKLNAMNRNDKAGIEKAEAEKEELLKKSKEYGQKTIDEYSKIMQNYKNFERTDEVLYFLGMNLMELNDERRALLAYNRLIGKFQKSKYLPDAYLAVGEYHFNNSKGKRDELEKALEMYKNAAKFPDNQVYGYAMYKQGWCHFNLSDYEKAQDQFKAVVLYAKFAGDKEAEGGGGKTNRSGLAKEARGDYVRAYERGGGTPQEARERFGKLADAPEDIRGMIKGLAGLYYEDGKDKEAALAYDMLIKERPTSPEAPGFQGKIVDCVMRAGNKRMTVQQVRRLVKIMDDVVKGTPNMADKDKKSLDEARELSERTISNLAVTWHNEAKRTKDEDTFKFANEVYADYLTLFPDNAKSYDLRFFWATLLDDNLNLYERAAEEYTKVLLVDVARLEKGEKKPGKYMTEAAYRAILARDEVVKKMAAEKGGKVEANADPTKKLPIPAEKQALIEASERYLKYIEKGDKKVEIAYKITKIYYDYNYLEDQFIPRCMDIAHKYPEYKFEDGTLVGQVCVNLVLDSYNLLGDWARVNQVAREVAADPKLNQGKLKEDLEPLIPQSSFKLCELTKEPSKSADCYSGFVKEFPKHELACRGLWNSGIGFYNSKQLDKAIEVRRQIIARYPSCQFVPQAMFALAEGHEAIAEFDKAADLYETYVAAYEKSKGKKGAPPPAPKKAAKKGGKDDKDDKKGGGGGGEQEWVEKNAQDGLFNAGIFREGLAQYQRALKDREKFLDLWPKAEEAEAVTKSIIDIYEKMGTYKKVIEKLEDYERASIKDPNKMLATEGRIATLYEDKLKNGKEAKRIYSRILDYYEKLNKKQKEGLEILALDAVARANYLANEEEWKKFSGVKIKWTRVGVPAELRDTIKAKATALREVQKVYTKTVSFKSADPAVCALNKIGLAYDQFVGQLDTIPRPKDKMLTDDLWAEVKVQLAQEIGPMRDQTAQAAAEAFTAVVQKSQELDVFNKCSIDAMEMLRKKYKPEQFPKMVDDVLELKAPAEKAMAIGGGVLVAVQPIPVKAGSMKAPDVEVKDRPVVRDEPPSRTPPPSSAKEPKEPKKTASNTGSSAPPPAPKAPEKKPDAPEPEEPL